MNTIYLGAVIESESMYDRLIYVAVPEVNKWFLHEYSLVDDGKYSGKYDETTWSKIENLEPHSTIEYITPKGKIVYKISSLDLANRTTIVEMVQDHNITKQS